MFHRRWQGQRERAVHTLTALLPFKPPFCTFLITIRCDRLKRPSSNRNIGGRRGGLWSYMWFMPSSAGVKMKHSTAQWHRGKLWSSLLGFICTENYQVHFKDEAARRRLSTSRRCFKSYPLLYMVICRQSDLFNAYLKPKCTCKVNVFDRDFCLWALETPARKI